MWSQSPALLTSIMPAIVRPRKTSRDSSLPPTLDAAESIVLGIEEVVVTMRLKPRLAHIYSRADSTTNEAASGCSTWNIFESIRTCPLECFHVEDFHLCGKTCRVVRCGHILCSLFHESTGPKLFHVEQFAILPRESHLSHTNTSFTLPAPSILCKAVTGPPKIMDVSSLSRIRTAD